MKYFITGASGVIGTHVLRRLQREDSLEAVCLEGDIRDRSSVLAQVAAAAPDVIVHLAALVPVREVNENPEQAYAVNVGGTLHLMEAVAALARRPRVFYASTSHVYAPRETPLDEEAPIAPRNLYATTKHLGEQIVLDLAQRLDAPALVGRMFSFYDAAQAPAFLYPAIRRRLAEEDLTKPFELPGAHAVRDLSPAETIAHQALDLIASGATGIVNLGSGRGTRIMDFVQSLTEQPLDIVPVGGNESLVADTAKLASLLRSGTDSV